MATLATTNPTLADLAKRTDPDGTQATIIELLSETNEILDQMSWINGNQTDGHLTTVRTGLPQPTWRKIYGGVQPAKSTTAQIKDSTGGLEAYAEADKKLVEMADNPGAFRLSEARAHLEGMNQEMASTLFYGNEGTEPEAFTGFAPRYNDLSAENADNIIDAQGTGSDNASIWLVVWGPETCHGIVPKNMTAGLQQRDLGEDTAVKSDGSMYQVYRDHFEWHAGLTVRDWRYVVRIANIDRSNLTFDASGGADLVKLITQALEIPPSLTMGRAAFYMDRKPRSILRTQMVEKIKNSTLTMEDIAGRRVMAFDGVPVYRVDALGTNEAQVT